MKEEAALRPDQTDAHGKRDASQGQAESQRRPLQGAGRHVHSAVEEVERHEKRGEELDRVQICGRRELRKALVQQARDQACDECADQVVHAQLFRKVGRQQPDHHQQRKLGADRIRHDKAHQHDKQQGQQEQHCCQCRGRPCQALE